MTDRNELIEQLETQNRYIQRRMRKFEMLSQRQKNLIINKLHKKTLLERTSTTWR